MSRSVLVISYDPLAARLKEFVEQRYQRSADCFCLPRRLFDREPEYDVDEYIRYYEGICRYLEENHSPAALRNFIVIFTLWAECQTFDKWNPLLYYRKERSRAHPQELLLSWLVLTYPEIRWVFMNDAGKECQHTSQFHWISPELDLSEILWHTACIPLFDPCGLRNKIREIIIRQVDPEGQHVAFGIPLRPKQAAAIDEESNYVYMNAYAAYRFGYRSWGINSWKILESAMKGPQEEFDILLEDLYWSFSDSPIDTSRYDDQFSKAERHFSNLKYRDTVLPGFEKARWRILVTIGPHQSEPDKHRWLENKRYLKTLASRVKILFKPFAGIFDLWKKAGLWNNSTQTPRQADGFRWPPLPKAPPGYEGSHSAPGRLLNIAQRLIRRANRILERPQSVADAIQAAVLALEAKELLAGRTPTTALEALELQHEAEIVAESMFLGIEYNLNVNDRFRDIEREVNFISRGFNPQTSKRSAINARLSIIEKLANRFRELNQFEEEHECLAEARWLRLNFWLRQRPVHWLAWPFVKYLDVILRSLGHFLVIVAIWIIFFTLLYFFGKNGPYTLENLWHVFAESFGFFFTTEPMNNGDNALFGSTPLWHLALGLQGLVAFSNLGLLLAHIYMIISRK